jgi:hypothetical protein
LKYSPGCELDDPEFESRQGKKFFSPKCPDWLWGPSPASYSMGTLFLSLGKIGWGVKFTIHLYLVPRLRISGVIPPRYLNDVDRDNFNVNYKKLNC